MKVVISLFIGFLLFAQQDVFCQKKGKITQSKQKQKAKLLLLKKPSMKELKAESQMTLIQKNILNR